MPFSPLAPARPAVRARRRLERIAATSALALLASIAVSLPAEAVTDVTVIDLSPGSAPRNAAITPDGMQLLVPNELSDTVSVVSTVTNTITKSIPTTDAPSRVAISPDGAVAYVSMNGAAAGLQVIEMDSLTVVGTILAGPYPQQVVFSPDSSTAYVAGYTSDSIFVIDVASGVAIDEIHGLTSVQSLSLTSDGTTLWFAGNWQVHHMDVATHAVSSPIVLEQVRWIALSPDETRLAAGGDQTHDVSFIDTSTDTIVEAVDVGQTPLTMAYNLDGTRLYVGLATQNIAQIDTTSYINLGDITTGNASWNVVMSPSGDFGYAINRNDNTATVFGDQVRRLSGASRYDTAIAVSQQAFPAGAKVVLIATGQNYPDALAAGPAAAALTAPLLLTSTASLPIAVRNEIIRLHPDRIIVVGGAGAVSAAVFSSLVPLADDVERAEGANRYATARAITEKAFGPGTAPEVYIATGRNFPDALSASAVGAALGRPVLLVDGSASSLDTATTTLLSSLGATHVFIAGGTGVVSTGISTQLSNIGYVVERLGGANRYATSLKINAEGYDGASPAPIRAIIATGVNFPDALAGSAWAGKVRAPLFIVPGTCIPQGMLDELTSLGIIQSTLIGGTGVLTAGVFNGTVCP